MPNRTKTLRKQALSLDGQAVANVPDGENDRAYSALFEFFPSTAATAPMRNAALSRELA